MYRLVASFASCSWKVKTKSFEISIVRVNILKTCLGYSAYTSVERAAVAQLVEATNLQVAGSIPDGATGFFHYVPGIFPGG
jgi:hypothetical protein